MSTRRSFFGKLLAAVAAPSIPISIKLPRIPFSGYRSRKSIEQSLMRQMAEDITKEIDAAICARILAEVNQLHHANPQFRC